MVRARVERDGRSTLVELELNPGKANRARVNRGPVPRARRCSGLLRTVLFAPEDLALVRGDPGERRRFLDDLLVLRAPRFAGVRADYERVLKQRNALLKTAFLARRSGGGDMRTLDVWDSHLARAGAELLAARLALVEDAAAAASPSPTRRSRRARARRGWRTGARSTAGPDAPGCPTAPTASCSPRRCSASWRGCRPQEVERGVSLVGPHRDELRACRWATCPCAGYASHGESWSFALALRLACYELLVADGRGAASRCWCSTTCSPSSTSAGGSGWPSWWPGAEQVLVTAAVADDVPEALVGGRYDVHGGTVTRVR